MHSPLIIEAHRWMLLPTVWGEHDCMLVLADWFKRVHGYDPAEHLRFMYDSPASCHKLTGWMRDPLSVVRDVAETHGKLEPKTGDPVKGDIALLRVIEDSREVSSGGVWMGKGWLIKGSPHGATIRSPRTVQVVEKWGMRYVDP